jgi:hypothetical protein
VSAALDGLLDSKRRKKGNCFSVVKTLRDSDLHLLFCTLYLVQTDAGIAWYNGTSEHRR